MTRHKASPTGFSGITPDSPTSMGGTDANCSDNTDCERDKILIRGIRGSLFSIISRGFLLTGNHLGQRKKRGTVFQKIIATVEITD
jgi:hypothetical protein